MTVMRQQTVNQAATDICGVGYGDRTAMAAPQGLYFAIQVDARQHSIDLICCK